MQLRTIKGNPLYQCDVLSMYFQKCITTHYAFPVLYVALNESKCASFILYMYCCCCYLSFQLLTSSPLLLTSSPSAPDLFLSISDLPLLLTSSPSVAELATSSVTRSCHASALLQSCCSATCLPWSVSISATN